ncbi:putative mismatch repair-like protein [Pedobacter sp. BAL39]|uniref:MutS-related protein n=1 Tax=Pedobacter sp. BAL39 TaxID=391596 RepID=UPI0001559E5D|nr:DNA mismatch repair protein [Pedobacter sp. BAL39]EDM35530.1 putative mismatch repair-like protein [Pedobacter sp. BAL39]
MLFTTDKQTLDDLNIFGKHGSDSVYQIFNRTNTRGGAALLEAMFQYPLSDADAVNKRSGIIQYFAAMNWQFPFATAWFDAAELYLSNTDERTKLSAQDHSVTQRLSNLVATDAETTTIHNGITALTDLLQGLRDFIGALQLEAGHCYFVDYQAIRAQLHSNAFSVLFSRPRKGRLSAAVFAEYDALLRFRYRDEVKRLLTYVYQLDVYQSVARVAMERGFIFPKALPRDRHLLRLKGVYHPQVKNAVANNISIDERSNVIFLTGANMAGKSTFMKSLSIALFLAHAGFPVAAAEMEFSVLDGIYTTINLPDDLGMGASHFYAEVLRAKKIAAELQSGKQLFVLFDELFRGTNVKDACEATVAFTEAFAHKPGSMFVISTHIIEAGEVLKERNDHIQFVFLPTKMNGNKPVYTYTLEEGLTADRHGMIIINNEGILEILRKGLERIHKKPIN